MTLAHTPKAFGQDDDFFPRNLIFCDRLADYGLGRPVAVHVGSIPSVKTSVEGCFEERQGL